MGFREYSIQVSGVILFIVALILYYNCVEVGIRPSASNLTETVRYKNLLALVILTPGTLGLFLSRLVGVASNSKQYRLSWQVLLAYFVVGFILLMSNDLYIATGNLIDVPALTHALIRYSFLGAIVIGIGVVESIKPRI